jgi:hypothetical protein
VLLVRRPQPRQFGATLSTNARVLPKGVRLPRFLEAASAVFPQFVCLPSDEDSVRKAADSPHGSCVAGKVDRDVGFHRYLARPRSTLACRRHLGLVEGTALRRRAAVDGRSRTRSSLGIGRSSVTGPAMLLAWGNGVSPVEVSLRGLVDLPRGGRRGSSAPQHPRCGSSRHDEPPSQRFRRRSRPGQIPRFIRIGRLPLPPRAKRRTHRAVPPPPCRRMGLTRLARPCDSSRTYSAVGTELRQNTAMPAAMKTTPMSSWR